MAEPSARMTSLSPAKQQLLRRLLAAPADAAPVRPPEPAVATLPTSPAGVLSRAMTGGRDAKAVCQQFYDTVTRQLNASAFGPFAVFLNYGYVANLSPQYAAVHLPERMLNRNSAQLVLEVLEDCVTSASRVLDVGCGRGGTVSVVTEFFAPARMVGIDISAAAIAFAREAHRHPVVTFLQGDAERLPFRDGCFDIVTNVESSSCYPDPHAFYGEVRRVLAPGGRFLYTDCLPVERFEQGIEALKALGFMIERNRDITANVLLSCDEIARTRAAAYGAGNDAVMLNDFLGAPGSQYYEDMRLRRWVYRICKLHKPEG
jgi:phthiocerol/phenolphthiocerol synthesis type-I polyketide synthase E